MGQISIFLAGQDEDEWVFLDESLADAEINANVNFFDTGPDLLENLKAAEQKPDVIFLDMDTLSARGIHILREIRKLVDYKTIPVVMFSTTSYLDDIDNAYSNGANLFVPKPVFMKEKDVVISTIFSLNWRNTLLIKDRILFVLNSASAMVRRAMEKLRGK